MKHIFSLLLLTAFLVMSSSCNSDSPKKEITTSSAEKETSKKQPPNGTSLQNKKEEKAPLAKASARSLSRTIVLGKIDYNLIDLRLLEKINIERNRLGLSRFTTNSKLNRAAKIHNDYMVSANILDHKENGTSTPQMRDRINKVNGKFRTAGENIQFEGFTIRTTNGAESIIAPTYEVLTEQLWQNWKTSPPHYKNLINPEFTYLGTALKWSDKKTAIFATQVYGG